MFALFVCLFVLKGFSSKSPSQNEFYVLTVAAKKELCLKKQLPLKVVFLPLNCSSHIYI